MRTSQLLFTTLREAPSDAEIISHQLMIRAGLIRKLGSGLYTWMPLGLRVLNRVLTVVREEMNAIGAQELLMPTVQPAELWKETKRWDQFGPLLLKMKDRHLREFCLGPTHEEVITDVMRQVLQSYRQLPQIVYQIQTKFRDETRPRFGVMRAREFLMKDAYSFHLTEASLQETYEAMYQAYSTIFKRLGLRYRAVLADTGAIGGSQSHEFHVLADSGEDALVYSDESDYAANVELAVLLPLAQPRMPHKGDIMKVISKRFHPLESVATYLKVPTQQCVQTLLVRGKEHPMVAILLRGDTELNELKAEKHPLIASPLCQIDKALTKESLHCSPEFVGPVGLSCPIIADHGVASLSDFACGANKNDHYLINVNFGRDLPEPTYADLRKAAAGDPSPDGHGTLMSCRGIEVGHIFQLGKKYSEAMQFTVVDDYGQIHTPTMGCYGIGVSRIVAACIEQHHDEKGIIWPDSMTPFQIALVALNAHQSKQVQETAEKLYQELQTLGYSVLLEDRPERAGVLFADMDLIGIPHRFVLSERTLKTNTIEYKHRQNIDSQNISLEQLTPFLKEILGAKP